MPKRNSDKKPPAAIKVKSDETTGFITEIRKYRLITPLYGGGVEPGKADPITVVRAAEIRGHLRFWWRATRGGAFNGNLNAMRQREEEIWGSAGGKEKAGPSKVSIAVIEKPNPGKIVRKVKDNKGHQVDYGDVKSPYGYVAFPLRKTDDKEAGFVQEGVAFAIEIRYDRKYQKDVQAALWAWETFGGIGARTRRGFGALQREDISTPCHRVVHEIQEGLAEHVVRGHWPEGVPNLGNAKYVLTSIKPTAEQAWRTLFNALKNFRQDRKPKMIKGKPRPFGRSKWPEPDEIRRRFGPDGHSPGHTPTHPVHKFPRGQFGLPIIFKFKDDTKGDPDQTSLEGAGHDRLASPLILRPLACSDGAVGLALILQWEPVDADEPYTPPGGLVLKGAPDARQVRSKLTPEEAQHIPVLKGNPNVLQAFLAYLKGK